MLVKGILVVMLLVGAPDAVVYMVSLMMGSAAFGLANSTLYSTHMDPGESFAVHVTTAANATASSR